jgi:hypothetical protein
LVLIGRFVLFSSGSETQCGLDLRIFSKVAMVNRRLGAGRSAGMEILRWFHRVFVRLPSSEFSLSFQSSRLTCQRSRPRLAPETRECRGITHGFENS